MLVKKRIRTAGLASLLFIGMPAVTAVSNIVVYNNIEADVKLNIATTSDNSPAAEIISFAKKFIGVQYRYGASSPTKGFDCSGYVYYVFKKFNINLPRSSSAIGQAGEQIALSAAKAGDIILFTGTNPSKRTIGHVGIVLSNDSSTGLRFIHASSGKAQAVTETPLEGSYKRRFMKVIRVL